MLGPACLRDCVSGYEASLEELGKLRAGDFLKSGEICFQLMDKFWMPDHDGRGAIFLKLKADKDCNISGQCSLEKYRKGFSLAWITLSDKGAKGDRIDQSGPLIADMVRSSLGLSLSVGYIIPDDYNTLRSLLMHLCLEAGFDLVITTGGTGLGPRDVTPEATNAVLDKRLKGFEQAMLNASLNKTCHAVISRAAAGTLGLSLIINLPGSPKGVKENLEAVLPAVEHALKKLQGDQSECAA
ncbi:MogA/MoaB family molybdenum cofactor biosynthesis protein [Desulfonatronovibrio magnus]|uniref:MogA/MoaB family molybdenum cofactor biosynthesis protein n=1 Tax=Desulfonatronovibrio magnus TaxID=698827 RepID=UPI0005EB6813|nr:MogA/MoaB family molybdenum cofactor biosynthesis protein [Desulfonatronovibrio magnus]